MNKKNAYTTKIVLRELNQSEILDIFPLISLHNPSLTKRQFTARLKDMLPFGYRAMAAFDGTRIIAISGFWIHSRFWCGRHLDIDNFFVHPDHRGAKIGSQLVAWLEATAIAEKCDLIVLDTYVDKFLTHRFYHREGFAATGYHFTKVPGSKMPWDMKG